MEGLETGPMSSSSSDPLLSAALSSRSPATSTSEEFRSHLSDSSYRNGRLSPHSTIVVTTAAFNQYTTLTNLQPLPPISTVTNSSEKFARSSPPVTESRTNNSSTNLFFQTPSSSALSAPLSFNTFPYNVNIKYEYDMKTEPEIDDTRTEPVSGRQASDFSNSNSLHLQLQQINEFSPSHSPYVPPFTSVIELRAPKQEKLCFGTANTFETFTTSSEILDSGTIERNERVSFYLLFFISTFLLFFFFFFVINTITFCSLILFLLLSFLFLL